jgi:hypothetical protein
MRKEIPVFAFAFAAYRTVSDNRRQAIANSSVKASVMALKSVINTVKISEGGKAAGKSGLQEADGCN